jgi:hypothetical protein
MFKNKKIEEPYFLKLYFLQVFHTRTIKRRVFLVKSLFWK